MKFKTFINKSILTLSMPTKKLKKKIIIIISVGIRDKVIKFTKTTTTPKLK